MSGCFDDIDEKIDDHSFSVGANLVGMLPPMRRMIAMMGEGKLRSMGTAYAFKTKR